MSNGIRTILTQEQIEEIVKLYESGFTMTELGKKYNCSPTTIKNKLKLAGIQSRPAGFQMGNIPKGKKNLIGYTFGNLTVLEETDKRTCDKKVI